MLTYHFLGFLWTVALIKAIAWTAIAGAVSFWYFFISGGGAAEFEVQIQRPISGSLYRVLRYHVGSCCFGAFCVALCQLIRYMLACVSYYTKDLQDSNFLLKLALCCAKCAIYCLEKTIEFISNYGYIYVAIEGMSFCSACHETFKFVFSNPAQTAVNKTVEKLLVFTITLTTPIVCAFACWASLNAQDFLNPLYPSALIFVIAFFIAESIATLFECTIDTIYVCSFRDAKEFGGKFMTKELRDAFGLDEAVAEKEATKTQVAGEASQRIKRASTGLQMNDSATLKGNASI